MCLELFLLSQEEDKNYLFVTAAIGSVSIFFMDKPADSTKKEEASLSFISD